jgi:RND family efflux transporter MFP subunit
MMFLAVIVLSCTNNRTAHENRSSRLVEPAESKHAEVSAVLLKYSDFNYEIISNGTVASTKKADVRFKISEDILRIYVKNGDRVVAGQKLAELDTRRLQLNYEQAVNNLERAKLDFENTLIDRGYMLKDSANIPAEEIKLTKIRSSYDVSVSNLRIAEFNLKDGTLYAPFDGIVANMFAQEHNLPGSEPFCTIVDDKSQEVIFHILENELSLVNIGDRLIVNPFAEADCSVEGEIREINPLVNKNGMVRIKASVNNRSGKLYEGMNVKVRVQRLMSRQLVIPKSALVLRSNQKVVFTFKDSKAIWVYVDIGQENSDSYVVTSGLNEGDSVIYKGNINLAHEAPVILIND